jgi:4-hydroxy-tetrahydrodipicolinate synthase
MVQFVKTALDGNFEHAKELHYKLLPFFKAEFIDTNPIPIKYMMSLKNLIKETYRLPLCSMNDKEKEQVKTILKKMEII